MTRVARVETGYGSVKETQETGGKQRQAGNGSERTGAWISVPVCCGPYCAGRKKTDSNLLYGRIQDIKLPLQVFVLMTRALSFWKDLLCLDNGKAADYLGNLAACPELDG